MQKELPEGFVHTELKGFEVFLNTKITKELEAEGLAREIVRRIQQARKSAKLEKQDEIMLAMTAEQDTLDLLKLFLKNRPDYIQAKAGAKIVELSSELAATAPARQYANKEEFKIKDKKFEILFERV